MYFHTAIIAFVLLVLVNAATLHVDVGKGGALKFDPEIITASEGDMYASLFISSLGKRLDSFLVLSRGDDNGFADDLLHLQL